MEPVTLTSENFSILDSRRERQRRRPGGFLGAVVHAMPPGWADN
jgi:hypothetical protein